MKGMADAFLSNRSLFRVSLGCRLWPPGSFNRHLVVPAGTLRLYTSFSYRVEGTPAFAGAIEICTCLDRYDMLRFFVHPSLQTADTS